MAWSSPSSVCTADHGYVQLCTNRFIVDTVAAVVIVVFDFDVVVLLLVAAAFIGPFFPASLYVIDHGYYQLCTKGFC